jgi:acyl-CoA reductase-like NAD-dependent aldehyde dehydrogenase
MDVEGTSAADRDGRSRIAARLRAGTVSAKSRDALGPQATSGGYQQSGTGRGRSLYGIEKLRP